ncbi:hypothetical protein M407DRAFT_204332 [Tulasnella calospora MUT 4182]|uniref:Uncharacterized protein n=1 Tax=Tulasnella calospora MUT 4182 TaxID=1051891 RepID=A0A0C3LGG2_9AGAM|nr:hypothetical protein M407DRAFT_204332 [Tulasnella calospora MUT 4182]
MRTSLGPHPRVRPHLFYIQPSVRLSSSISVSLDTCASPGPRHCISRGYLLVLHILLHQTQQKSLSSSLTRDSEFRIYTSSLVLRYKITPIIQAPLTTKSGSEVLCDGGRWGLS